MRKIVSSPRDHRREGTRRSQRREGVRKYAARSEGKREREEGAKKDRARRFEDDATNANLTFPFARKKRRR